MADIVNISIIQSGQLVTINAMQGAYGGPPPSDSPYDKRGMYSLPSGNLSGNVNFVTSFQYGNPSFSFPLGVIGINVISASITSINATGFYYLLGGATQDANSLLSWRILQ